MLELMKYGILEAAQEGIDGDIWVETVPDADVSRIDIETEFDVE